MENGIWVANQLGYSFHHFQTWILGAGSLSAKYYRSSSQGKLKTEVKKPETTNIVVKSWVGMSHRGETSNFLQHASDWLVNYTCMKWTQWQVTKVWTRTRTASQETQFKVKAQLRKTLIKKKNKTNNKNKKLNNNHWRIITELRICKI